MRKNACSRGLSQWPVRVCWRGPATKPMSVVWRDDTPPLAGDRHGRARARGSALPAPNDHWPQFRGPSAGVAEDDPALPERWSTDENIVWTRRVPGVGWSSPVVWGDHVFVTTVINSGTVRRLPKPGLYFGGERGPPPRRRTGGWCTTSTSRPARCAGRRKCADGVPAGPKHLKNSYASETPVTDGERVYVYFGNVGLFVFDLNGTPVWSKPIGPFKTRIRMGHGRVAGSPPRSDLHRQRQRRPVVPGGVRQADGRRDLARRIAPRAPTGRRRSSGSTIGRAEIVTSGSDKSALLRPDGQAALGIHGDVEHQHPDAVRAPRPAVHLRRDTSAIRCGRRYAIRPGASGDISLKPGETSNRVHRLVGADAGAAYNPTPLVYGDYYYTLFDRGFFTCHDAEDRQGDLRPPAHRRATRAASRRRRGRTTARSSR